VGLLAEGDVIAYDGLAVTITAIRDAVLWDGAQHVVGFALDWSAGSRGGTMLRHGDETLPRVTGEPPSDWLARIASEHPEWSVRHASEGWGWLATRGERAVWAPTLGDLERDLDAADAAATMSDPGAPRVQVVLADIGGWINGPCGDEGFDAEALAALRLAAGEPPAGAPLLARVPAPLDVPAGLVVVHAGDGGPASRIGWRGFRAWLAPESAGLEPCGCGWAPRLGRHYRPGGAS
jgi:hypothetical protein